MKEIELPFTVREVLQAVNWIWCAVGSMVPPTSFACIDFLRPKSPSFYLFQAWNSYMSKEVVIATARRVGREIDNETRMANGELGGIVPDWELYTVASWMYRTGQWSSLHAVLDEYPSARLWCVTTKGNSNAIVRAMDCQFKDKFPSCAPTDWLSKWTNYHHTTSSLTYVTEARQYRRLLALMGLQCKLLGNEDVEVTYPFGKKPRKLLRALRYSLIHQLTVIDPAFSQEDVDRAVAHFNSKS